ncbi:MAG: spore germination protein [Clostridiales bacterium]|nr:spore germination protein [Clostridiales bacterium]
METTGAGTESWGGNLFTRNLEDNITKIQNIFRNDNTLIVRRLETRAEPKLRYALIYCDGMVNNKLTNEDIIRPLLEFAPAKSGRAPADLVDVIAAQVTLSDSVEKTQDINQVIQAIVYGDSALFTEGFCEALILNTKGWNTRSISEPENEKILRGPREGFCEALMTNLSLVRRRLRTPDLKMEFQTFGTRSQTKGCVCYLDGLVNRDVLEELKKRLNAFSIDGTLDVNYINEFIRDAPYSPIKTIGSTEKPDVIAAKLLEGRVALFLDGTPVVLTVPHLFIEHFQSDEDYYVNYYFASIGRLLRLLAFFISTSVPAIYVALTTFHQEMLPTSLVISISMARNGVPFPTVVEAMLMLVVFEMLRESGARMPGMMGQALSIVGALVIGQAAVQAKIVSAPMIIIVALTGIAGLMVPRIKGTSILLRFGLLVMASSLGLYGYMFGMLGLMVHLYSVSSFGIPIMNSAYSTTTQDKKDFSSRAPWFMMDKRPKFLSPNRTRKSSGGNVS